jgi:predicted ATPase
VLWGLWLFHKARSELATARERAGELFALAQQLQDPALVLQSHQAFAVTTLCLGEPAATADQMERAQALYDPGRHQSLGFRFGQDPCVSCQAFGAVALWLLGYPDRALKISDTAVALSHRLTQPSSQTLALHFAAMLRQFRREPREVLTLAQLSHTIAAEHGFSFWLAGGDVMSGWSLAALRHPSGVQQLRQGLRDWRAAGSVTYHTYYLGLLAEVLAAEGQVEEAGLLVEEALALAGQTREGLYEAELYRLRGKLLEARAEPAAEASYRQALEVARRQQARSLELRAALSLGCLLQKQGRFAEVRPLLAGVYAGFTEGFDTPDLVEARTLLEQNP